MMIYRTFSRLLLPASLALILAACGASQSGTRAVEEAAALEAAHRQAEEQAAAARAAEEQVAAERTRVAALEAERERSAAAATREAREAAEIAQREAAREAEQARVQSEVLAREPAQQTQITQLERQIENTNNEVRELTAVNSSLEQAVDAAEELLRALNEEQLKYANTTPTGELVEPLDKDSIAALEARMEALKREAESQSR